MKILGWLAILMLVAASAGATDGVYFTYPKPSGSPEPKSVCIDICDQGTAAVPLNTNTFTCGPVYAPVQNAVYTQFSVVATTTPACAFDTIDIEQANSSTAPSNEHLIVYGTLDDDGAVDCGLGANIACKAVRVAGPLFGWVYVTGNSSTIGGASCARFRIRMCQTPP